MLWSWYVIGAALFLAAACSFFFALAESALFALGKWRAQQLIEDKPAQGARLAKLFTKPQDLLATLGFGNTCANGLLIGFTVWIITHSEIGSSNLHQALFGAAAFIFLLLGCEVIPKALGVRSPEFWSLRIARLLQISMPIATPFSKIAQGINESFLRLIVPKVPQQPAISDEEYQELLSIAQQQGALMRAEKEIILQILSLDKRTARDVMKPRSQISCISDDLSKDEMIDEARKIRHTRIPIYDDTPDTIVGVLNARALLLNPSSDLEEVMEFPSFVPETMNLMHLLQSLQRQQRGIAIVLDEFGGTAGLVTMEDILEDTLGSFHREDQTFRYEKLGPGRWRVNGLCTITEFRREFPALTEMDDVDTLSGWMVKLLEYVPTAGESITARGLRLTAQAVDDRRVRELLVEAQRK